MMFGVEPAADLGMPAEFIHHDVIIPAPVAVARAPFIAPNVSALTVQERLMFFGALADKIPFRPRVAILRDLVKMFAPGITRQVGMPGIDIGLDVIVVAGGVVFHETRR